MLVAYYEHEVSVGLHGQLDDADPTSPAKSKGASATARPGSAGDGQNAPQFKPSPGKGAVSRAAAGQENIGPGGQYQNTVTTATVLRVAQLNERYSRSFLFEKVLLPAFGSRKKDADGNTIGSKEWIKNEAYWSCFILAYCGCFLHGSPYLPQGIPRSVPASFLDHVNSQFSDIGSNITLSTMNNPLIGSEAVQTEQRFGKALLGVTGANQRLQDKLKTISREMDDVKSAQAMLLTHALDNTARPSREFGKMIREQQQIQAAGGHPLYQQRK